MFRAAGWVAPCLLLFAGVAAADPETPLGLSGLLSPAPVADGPPGCVRISTRE